ncbi:MAG TPA: hypothetical protein VL356_06010 [Acidocella sp.]|jgi:hypothetical protein|nr:hypothetical protein [Acidocella sp.]
MAMRSFGLVLAVATLSCSAAIAAPAQEHLRGTIASVSAGEILVHTRGGRDVPVLLNGGTHYLQVEKASLGHIEKGSYIGTATKSVGSTLVALEVVLFPPSMRGTGEGHYAWDKIADTTLAGGGTTASTMTNGNVAAVAAPAAMVNSSMTNGNVSASAAQNGLRQLTVSYKGGQQMIIVPPTAPIVTYRPGTVSEVTKGAPVFIKAVKNGNTITAEAVAVGIDGVTPPM